MSHSGTVGWMSSLSGYDYNTIILYVVTLGFTLHRMLCCSCVIEVLAERW